MFNQEIKNYFETQKSNPDSSLSFVELLELSVKEQKFSSDLALQLREKLLVLKLLTSSVYQFFLDIDGIEVFNFGIEIKKKSNLLSLYESHLKAFASKANSGEIEIRKLQEFISKDVPFYAYSLSYREESRRVFCFFVFPTKIQNSNLKMREIFQIIRNAFLFVPVTENKVYKPFYSEFKEFFLSSLKSYPYKTKSINGVLALFLVEDLALYGKYMGEQFISNIIQEIISTIQKYLKKSDMLFNLNRRLFITYLPDCSIEIVQQRFENVIFKIEPIVLKYDLVLFPIDHKSLQKEEFLDKIFGQDFKDTG